jgi:hypothetical protein
VIEAAKTSPAATTRHRLDRGYLRNTVDGRSDEAGADAGWLLCCECVDKYSDFRFLKVAFELDERAAATRMVQGVLALYIPGWPFAGR